MDYKNAGVDIEAGYKAVELMKKHIDSTMLSHLIYALYNASMKRGDCKIPPHFLSCVRFRSASHMVKGSKEICQRPPVPAHLSCTRQNPQALP